MYQECGESWSLPAGTLNLVSVPSAKPLYVVRVGLLGVCQVRRPRSQ